MNIGTDVMDLVFTLIGALTSVIFWRLSEDVRQMTESVKQLNMNVAVVIERVDTHEKRITRLEAQ